MAPWHLFMRRRSWSWSRFSSDTETLCVGVADKMPAGAGRFCRAAVLLGYPRVEACDLRKDLLESVAVSA